MPTTLIDPVGTAVDASIGPRRKKWTREEVAALAKSGALNVERLELVEGELFDKMGKNLPHVNALHRMVRLLNQIFGIERVTHERAIDVAPGDQSTSAPEPDVTVLNCNFEAFVERLPQANEVSLLVEISETTLRYDLRSKSALYARAGIVEYWVVDLNGRKLFVHRQPEQGRYASVVVFDANESVTPLSAPGGSIAVKSLFTETATS